MMGKSFLLLISKEIGCQQNYLMLYADLEVNLYANARRYTKIFEYKKL